MKHFGVEDSSYGSHDSLPRSSIIIRAVLVFIFTFDATPVSSGISVYLKLLARCLGV
jgi:hypothetical protein